MNRVIYHGSERIIEHPMFGYGNKNNDYGRGFYCTENLELAKEWACKKETDGFANVYMLDMNGLLVCNLSEEPYNILNWLAVLTRHRSYWQKGSIAEEAKMFLQEHFYVDVSKFDVIIGYRADDSYFSYAQSFVGNALPLRSLNKALRLGKLGSQTVLISERAFEHIEFTGAEAVDREIYYPRFLTRDTTARNTYQQEIKKSRTYRDDIFVMDILREEIKNDDPRIQRIISE